MTCWQFVDRYLGKKVDFDGVYGAQCVDLFRQYCKEVWEVPRLEGVEGAKDLFLNYERMPLEKAHTDLTRHNGSNHPREGDVVIFMESPSNRYGHVAICLYAGERFMVVFEQDGFAQTGAKIGTWDYKRLLGWLSKKAA